MIALDSPSMSRSSRVVKADAAAAMVADTEYRLCVVVVLCCAGCVLDTVCVYPSVNNEAIFGSGRLVRKGVKDLTIFQLDRTKLASQWIPNT